MKQQRKAAQAAAALAVAAPGITAPAAAAPVSAAAAAPAEDPASGEDPAPAVERPAPEAISAAATEPTPAPDEPADLAEAEVVEPEVLETAPPEPAATLPANVSPEPTAPAAEPVRVLDSTAAAVFMPPAGEEAPLAFYRTALEEFASEQAQRVYQPNVNKGRTALFFAAVLILLFGTYSLVALLQSPDSPVGGSGMLWLTCLAIIYAPAAVFFGLWSWARKRPLTASLIGLALYPSYVALLAQTSGGAPLISFANVIHVAVVLTLLYAVKCSWSYRKVMAAMAWPI